MSEALPRWSVVEGAVTGHREYGLLVRVPSGETGLVDRADIADFPVAQADWPAIGSLITVVGAGYTGAGQLRLSARHTHLAQASARQPSRAVGADETWTRVAYARTRAEAISQFVAWKERTGRTPRDDEMRVNWGRHADGGDYWEILTASRPE